MSIGNRYFVHVFDEKLFIYNNRHAVRLGAKVTEINKCFRSPGKIQRQHGKNYSQHS